MFLSVIIPAYNEAKRIGRTLLSVNDFLSKQDFEYEIIIVSDGSKDSTAAVVESMKEQVKNLRLINNHQNHGKGWVVRQGMLEARGDFRLFSDADNSTSLDQLAGFLPYFDQGYDIVIGSRRIEGANIRVKQGLFRDFLGGVFRFIVHMLVPLGLSDSQAGFKVFSKKAAEAIFPKQTIFRWAFDVEILAIARKLGFKIKEAPIVWINDEQSHVRLSGMIGMLFEVLRIRLNLWGNKYKLQRS